MPQVVHESKPTNQPGSCGCANDGLEFEMSGVASREAGVASPYHRCRQQDRARLPWARHQDHQREAENAAYNFGFTCAGICQSFTASNIKALQ